MVSNKLIDNNNLIKKYNYEKNTEFELDKLTNGSSKKVWWKCSKCGHEWETTIYNRTYGTGCPKCKNKKIR